MKLSYWENKSWLHNVDFTVVGSGIVGLSCALELKSSFPKANILILERGILPQGASTKNAGFACFGSLSEILDDLKSHSEDEVIQLVIQRKEGLQGLRQMLSDAGMDFQQHGGYELFSLNDSNLYEESLSAIDQINNLLKPIFNEHVFSIVSNRFKFKNIQNNLILNQFEGQIDTGKMMEALLYKALSSGIKILNSISVIDVVETSSHVDVLTDHFQFKSNKVFIATNGFAKQLIDVPIQPARAQVLITKPINNLHLEGTFHLDKGYYYFRNIDNRILFGGGRNLDLKGEETTEMTETDLIQNRLETLLKTEIIPNTPFEIEQRWSGIMGVGNQKRPIIKQLSNHVFCGVRLGGMGVAIGSNVGKNLAQLLK